MKSKRTRRTFSRRGDDTLKKKKKYNTHVTPIRATSQSLILVFYFIMFIVAVTYRHTIQHSNLHYGLRNYFRALNNSNYGMYGLSDKQSTFIF